ncbi:MAG: DUF2062 domain-containing protein [Allosphingosinicella sp.]|uniref:DUF2062 domain-containing protein n=1 Tax=Allosphingosinicella sp. TaxID=2823234 RepID=UPI00393AC05D
MPTRESLLANRWIRPFAHRLTHPSLWHFNRWSVARGIALGLFCGFLVPLGQIFLAAFFALTVRANLIVAAAATLVTNPITFPAIYWAAYSLGQRLLSTSGLLAFQPDAADGYLIQSVAWLLSVSAPTALGLLLFAGLSAVFGYLAVHFGWRLWVQRRWASRQARRG